jgi:predicted MFS family arabinose efflux permease
LVVLFAVGAGYGGGNLGPAAGALSREFGASLSAVGLTMTLYFAAITAVTFASARIVRGLGVRRAVLLSCLMTAAGNVACAGSPWFAGILVGRSVTGLGAGLAFVAGPVVARSYGGARLVGAFGAAVTIGVAVALVTGSALADAGVSWRIGFVVSAVVGLAALASLPRHLKGTPHGPRPAGFIRGALRAPAMWRLIVLFVAGNGIALVISTWLIPYLVVHGGSPEWIAGVLGLVLFAVTAGMREASGWFAQAGPAWRRVAAVSPLLSAVGLVGIALDARTLPSVGWVVLMGVGFALPYALVIEGVQRLFPQTPAAAVALVQIGPNAMPMVVVPIIGSALAAGNGSEALLPCL